jgi:hypothetical protein
VPDGYQLYRGDWRARDVLPTLSLVQQTLRVNTAAVRSMTARWGASVAGLNDTTAPMGQGLSSQPSASAVRVAHVDVTAFAARLAARVGAHARGVTQADTGYLAEESKSAAEFNAVAQSVNSV